MPTWLLPENIADVLPSEARKIEELRRLMLDTFRTYGYELVMPPMLEYVESLLAGAGQDTDSKTFKLVDSMTGRLLGLRADMTPQAARIAARHFAGLPVVRLCYLGTVLRTRPDSLGGSRAPRQVGCEIFGEAGLSADLEILRLMLDTLRLAGIDTGHLDLGHVGIYRALAARLGLDASDETAVFDILQRKSHPDLRDFAAARKLAPSSLAGLSALMDLNGDVTVLQRARHTLDLQDPAIAEALAAVEQAAAELKRVAPEVPVHIDLAELRGYRYQTGLVFAAFVPGHGREVARGGRYDGVGSEFGAARPATGFSADLNELLRLGA